jgi:hypothetical protein
MRRLANPKPELIEVAPPIGKNQPDTGMDVTTKAV